jgi:hypothetical protein
MVEYINCIHSFFNLHVSFLQFACFHSSIYLPAFLLLASSIFIFYSCRKAFLQLWHDSFTAVEKHFYNCKNKFY